MTRLSRRHLNHALTAGVVGLAASALIGGTARADTRIRFFWWGNPERDKRTLAVVDLYQTRHAGVRIDPESLGWNDYWPKLATQAAGRNLADAVQMDYRYMFEYARRGQLEPLDALVGKDLELADFDAALLDTGRVEGGLYAVPLGGNSTASYIDKTRLAELGLELPSPDWTWGDLRKLAQELKKAAPEGVWGVADKGLWEPVLEIFVRQRGKSLYGEDGRLGYDEADVADYFGLWTGLRKDGLTPPGDITARDVAGLDTMPITGGRAIVDFAHSNQVVGLQALNPHELALAMVPSQTNGQPGQYLKPAMQLSIAKTSRNKVAAADFINFVVTDRDAAAILRVERGVPGDRRIRSFLDGLVDPVEKRMLDYMDLVTSRVGPIPPPPPKGAGEIEVMLRRVYPELTFDRLTVKDAASQFYNSAQAVLRRA